MTQEDATDQTQIPVVLVSVPSPAPAGGLLFSLYWGDLDFRPLSLTVVSTKPPLRALVLVIEEEILRKGGSMLKPTECSSNLFHGLQVLK